VHRIDADQGIDEQLLASNRLWNGRRHDAKHPFCLGRMLMSTIDALSTLCR